MKFYDTKFHDDFIEAAPHTDEDEEVIDIQTTNTNEALCVFLTKQDAIRFGEHLIQLGRSQ